VTPRFCSGCGARLPEGARFCPGCGGAVREAGTVATAAPAPAAERRQVVVMFADLAGYTSLTSKLDAEEIHRLLGRYFDVVDGIVASFGGTIDKHVGDAVMGLFGAPVAHHNDAERAVRAACAIHASLTDLAREIGVPLLAHVGVASGEVVAAGTGSAQHSTYTVTGDAVNLASRLEGLAQGGQTLVAAPVWRVVAGICDGEPAGRLEVKGLDAPVEAWRVLGIRAAAPDAPPLVGRVDELRQFDAALASVKARSSGRFLLLRGEAGIGKTRLAEACLERAEAAGFACHRALVLDFGVARGRGALAALVAGLLGAGASTVAEARSASLAGAIAAGRVAAGDEPFLLDLMELPQPARHRSTFEAMEPSARLKRRQAALAALVDGAARARPCLFVVEDLHWADAATLDGLAALARACASCPALLVATTRAEGDPIDPRWRAAVGPLPTTTLDLDRLDAEASTALAHALVEGDERRVLECIRRADGNPLFLVQLLREAGEGGGVPGSIASLVLSRIDGLAARDRHAVQAAAVIGQRFGLPLLRHLLGDDGYDCEPLVASFLVRPDGDEFLFAHALICDGAYASLLHSHKRALHIAAAHWYVGRDAQLRAQHLDRAGDPEAASAYVDAARERIGMLRIDEALVLAERGLALAQDAPVRHAATMLRAELLRDAGHTGESIDAFEAAARDAPDDASRCRALIGVAAGHRVASAPESAMATLAQAEPLATAQGLEREASIIHHLRGNLHFARGEPQACLAEHEQALRHARAAGDRQAEANALSGLGDAAYAGGRMRTGYARFAECVALARAQGLPRIESANLCMLGHCAGFLGEWDAGLAHVDEAIAIARRLALPHAQMFALESLAVMRFNRGEFDEADRAAATSLEAARAIGSRRYEAILLWVQGRVAHLRGDARTARACFVEVRAIMESAGLEGFLGAPLTVGEALVAPDAETARRSLAEGEAMLARGALGHCHYWFRRDAIDVALALDDEALALAHCDALEDYARGEPLPWSDFHAARGRALIAWRRAPSPAARGTLQALRERGAALGFLGALPGIEAALGP
jgi:class 3 adenylate cyclase/tetratricopeptide (TPR) repeat protein